jgi:hypothetical protein
MRRSLLILAALALSACDPKPAPTASPTPTPTPTAAPAAASLGEIATAHAWTTEPGEALSVALAADAQRILLPMTRAALIDALPAAGYQCQYGEATAEYPNPLQVCTRTATTDGCELGWELSTTASNAGQTETVDSTFTRNCPGIERDWPMQSDPGQDLASSPMPTLPPN